MVPAAMAELTSREWRGNGFGYAPRLRRVHLHIAAALVCTSLLSMTAGAVEIEMQTDAPSCSVYTSGVGPCRLTTMGQLTVTWWSQTSSWPPGIASPVMSPVLRC